MEALARGFMLNESCAWKFAEFPLKIDIAKKNECGHWKLYAIGLSQNRQGKSQKVMARIYLYMFTVFNSFDFKLFKNS